MTPEQAAETLVEVRSFAPGDPGGAVYLVVPHPALAPMRVSDEFFLRENAELRAEELRRGIALLVREAVEDAFRAALAAEEPPNADWIENMRRVRNKPDNDPLTKWTLEDAGIDNFLAHLDYWRNLAHALANENEAYAQGRADGIREGIAEGRRLEFEEQRA